MNLVRKISIFLILLIVLSLGVFAQGLSAPQPQRADLTITLNEQFFDAFLETLFKNFRPMEFSVAKVKGEEVRIENAAYRPKGEQCKEIIKLEREISGMRTAVRFREGGRMIAPLAFSGSYDIPLVGCVDFTGWAETQILMDFDRDKQTLFARVKVLNVNLNGVSGLASGVLGKLLQNAVDKKVNPTALVNAEKLSFMFPLDSLGGNLKMRATEMRPEVSPGELKIKIFYELSKN